MKYPSGIKKSKNCSNVSYKNRGMTLENDLNQTNEYYKSIDKAYIYKKPTPIKVTKADYPSRDKTIIKEAFFTVPSTTDYNGIYKGKYIDFEAKETKNKSSFPLANIHSHQIEHIKNIYRHDGIVFLIVRFTTINETYLLLGKDFIDFINNNSRKSIPLDFFRNNAYLLKDNYNPRIDYLKIIDEFIGGI